MTSLIDIIEQLDNVDDPDAGEMAKSNHALAAAMSMWRPVNWQGSGLTPDQILRVASENGIPVAWVPPTAVLVELAATEQAGRIGVLVARQHEVLDHCESLIAQCRDPELSDVQTLAGEALQALKAGHHAAAMALAVAVAEGPALWASERRVESFRTQQGEDKYKESLKFKYELAKEELEFLKSEDHRSRLNVMRCWHPYRSSSLGITQTAVIRSLKRSHGTPRSTSPLSLTCHGRTLCYQSCCAPLCCANNSHGSTRFAISDPLGLVTRLTDL